MHQLYSTVGTRTSLRRRNEQEQRIYLFQLVLAFSHAIPPSTPGPRTRPGVVSMNLLFHEIEPCDRRLRSPCRCRLKSRPLPRARHEFLIWHCVTMRWNFAGTLSSSSGCNSGLPKRTSMTSPSITVGASSSRSHSSVMSAKCRVRPSRTASVRLGNSDVTVSIPSASSLVAGLTCVR